MQLALLQADSTPDQGIFCPSIPRLTRFVTGVTHPCFSLAANVHSLPAAKRPASLRSTDCGAVSEKEILVSPWGDI